ncbi:MAG: hypothetical protein KC680_01440 [Candidatus Peregrinibacteria bacterium]|nr:hypothetical protein [Candidatus Peregrinibacteria bacterium]MCB9808047.1 hypothetical protein [Candidatus Peribacteria bacterium]
MEEEQDMLYVGPGGTYQNVPKIREIAKRCNGDVERFQREYFECFYHAVQPFTLDSPHFKQLWDVGGHGLVRIA